MWVSRRLVSWSSHTHNTHTHTPYERGGGWVILPSAAHDSGMRNTSVFHVEQGLSEGRSAHNRPKRNIRAILRGLVSYNGYYVAFTPSFSG